MPATLTTVSNILKEVYEPQLQEQLNDDAVTLKRIEKSSEGISTTVGGKYVEFGVHVRRNAGIGARNELEALPVAGQQGFNQARVTLKYLYGLARLSGQVMELADKNYQAFASALDQEMEGLTQDLTIDQNRQVYGDQTGRLSTVVTGHTTSNLFTPGTGLAIYAQLGMQVDVIDGTTITNPTPTVKLSNAQITAINTSTGEITLSATVTTVAGDILVRTGNVNREWTGFNKIIAASGAVYGLDPAAEPLWASVVDSNGGSNRALSEGLMISLVDRIRANGGKVTAIFANLGVRRAYFNLLTQQRRFTGSTSFAGGFTGLTFTTDAGDIPVVVDIMAPYNRMYFINEKAITLYREGDWSFMNRDGSNWQRVIGFDAYEATMFQYSEIGCHRRNTQGMIQDVTEG